nr:chemokine XC receptor 1-like isoform X2 [Cavia porcellus]
MEYWKTPEPTTFVDYDPQSPLCENEYIDLRNLDNVLPLVILLLTLLLNLVVNSLVLRALVMYNGLQSFTTFFFFNLCVSDLVSSFLLLLWVFREHWSLVLCKAVRMTFSLGLYSNMFVPTIMTLYLSVVRPQCMPLDLNLRCRVLLAAAMWVASVLSSIPDAIFFEADPQDPFYFHVQGSAPAHLGHHGGLCPHLGPLQPHPVPADIGEHWGHPELQDQAAAGLGLDFFRDPPLPTAVSSPTALLPLCQVPHRLQKSLPALCVQLCKLQVPSPAMLPQSPVTFTYESPS